MFDSPPDHWHQAGELAQNGAQILAEQLQKPCQLPAPSTTSGASASSSRDELAPCSQAAVRTAHEE